MRLIAVVVLPLLMSSCSSSSRILPPYSPRVPVHVAPLVDRTGDYHLISIPFDSLAAASLLASSVVVDERSQSNQFAWSLCQNPFMPIGSGQRAKALYVLEGEVERVSYEPAADVTRRLAAMQAAGVIGLALTDPRGGMAAFVQYRFRVRDASGAALDSFVVVGAASGHPERVSRQTLTDEANYAAGCAFATQFILRMVRRGAYTVERIPAKHYDKETRFAACVDSTTSRMQQLRMNR